MEKETLEQKQKYLRDNVLEKGYDPDKFMEFLTMKKGEQGIQLDNWTFQELIDVTNEFLINNKTDIERNYIPKEEKEEDEKLEKDNKDKDINKDMDKDLDKNMNNNNIDKNIDKNIENEEDINVENKNEIIPQKIEERYSIQDDLFPCTLIEETPIKKIAKLEIEVTNPKIEKNGIFSFSHSTYLIVTPALKVQVRRKFTDFLWLYNILKKQFTNCIVPPFFKKKENLDKNKMLKRIYFIEKFLNGIAVHPILRNSIIFYDFLSIQDAKIFVKSKNQYDKIPSPLITRKIKSLDGQMKVSFNEDNEIYYNKIKSKIINQELIYDKLIYHYKLLLININQTISQMKDISNIWKELYNKKNDYFESQLTSGIYDSYIKIMEKWAVLQNDQCKLIINSIKKYFRFTKEEYNGFKDLSLIVDNNKKKYYDKSKKLLISKESFLAKKSKEKEQDNIIDNNKIDNNEELEFNRLMSKDIIKLNEYKVDYGSYLNFYICEYERLRDLNDIRFKDNLNKFVKDLSGQVSGFTFNLGEILSFIDTLN